MPDLAPKKSREERLAEKLRENLKRRKSQSRARSTADIETSGVADGHPNPDQTPQE